MQILTRFNKVIAYSEHGYTPVGASAICAVTGKCYDSALIVTVDGVPTDIDSYNYYYVNGKFVKGDSNSVIREINHHSELQFWVGTKQEYEALPDNVKHSVYPIFKDGMTTKELQEYLEQTIPSLYVSKSGGAMTGGLSVPEIVVQNTEKQPIGWFRVNSSGYRVYMGQKTPSSEFAEEYYLPQRSGVLTSSVQYDILTSKNPVTIEQGGTGATTLRGVSESLKVYPLHSTATIPHGTDLNDYNTADKVGQYCLTWMNANTTGHVYGNLPDELMNNDGTVNWACCGKILVETDYLHNDAQDPATSQNVIQTLYLYNNTQSHMLRKYIRVCANGTFHAWQRIMDDTTAVKKTGDTMTGDLTAPRFIIKSESNGWVSYVFKNSEGLTRADIMVNGGTTGDLRESGRLIFDQYLMDAEGNRTDVVAADGKTYACQERFQLPTPTAEGFGGDNKIHQKWYSILTSKSPVTVVQGGTGATDAATARTNLGITPANIGAAPASHNHSANNITSGTLGSNRLPTVPIDKGGTGATNAAMARINLGIVIGDDGVLRIGGTIVPQKKIVWSGEQTVTADGGLATSFQTSLMSDCSSGVFEIETADGKFVKFRSKFKSYVDSSTYFKGEVYYSLAFTRVRMWSYGEDVTIKNIYQIIE